MATKLLKSATVNEECVERYKELNRAVRPLWRFVMYKVNEDETEIIVDYCCPIESSEEEVTRELKSRISPQHASWIVMTVSYQVAGGGIRNKTTFIAWIPDTLTRETLKESARVKMMSLGCGGELKRALKGIVCFIEANNDDEFSFEYWLSKVSKHEREPLVSSMLFGTQQLLIDE